MRADALALIQEPPTRNHPRILLALSLLLISPPLPAQGLVGSTPARPGHWWSATFDIRNSTGQPAPFAVRLDGQIQAQGVLAPWERRLVPLYTLGCRPGRDVLARLEGAGQGEWALPCGQEGPGVLRIGPKGVAPLALPPRWFLWGGPARVDVQDPGRLPSSSLRALKAVLWLGGVVRVSGEPGALTPGGWGALVAAGWEEGADRPRPPRFGPRLPTPTVRPGPEAMGMLTGPMLLWAVAVLVGGLLARARPLWGLTVTPLLVLLAALVPLAPGGHEVLEGTAVVLPLEGTGGASYVRAVALVRARSGGVTLSLPPEAQAQVLPAEGPGEGWCLELADDGTASFSLPARPGERVWVELEGLGRFDYPAGAKAEPLPTAALDLLEGGALRGRDLPHQGRRTEGGLPWLGKGTVWVVEDHGR